MRIACACGFCTGHFASRFPAWPRVFPPIFMGGFPLVFIGSGLRFLFGCVSTGRKLSTACTHSMCVQCTHSMMQVSLICIHTNALYTYIYVYIYVCIFMYISVHVYTGNIYTCMYMYVYLTCLRCYKGLGCSPSP